MLGYFVRRSKGLNWLKMYNLNVITKMIYLKFEVGKNSKNI